MTAAAVAEATTLQETTLQEEELESFVSRRLGGRVRGLRVCVRPDGIVLEGRTATYHAKQLAQHAVMEMTRLAILANDIEVC